MVEQGQPKVIRRIRRKGLFMAVTGVLYGILGLVIAGFFVWAFLGLTDRSDLVLSTQDYVLLALNGVGFFLASAWFIYAGMRLRNLPSARVASRLLWISLGIAVVTVSSIISIAMIIFTLSIIRRLPEYHTWLAS